MRFSNSGMWGQAVYFAVNSSYSHGYAHPLPNGCLQMFFANVIVGKYVELQPDKSLRIPPEIPGTIADRYDSVKGHTSGSDIFMVYYNKQAYPQYLITYKQQ